MVEERSNAAPAPSLDSDFVITRVFDAPRERVFAVWTEAERKTFDESHADMQMGWSGTFDQLDAYLAGALR